ncbi:MAG: hypothetical protein NZL83_01085 [Candidatus Absconditabacterales bacterium]|nr:hypothetical protein [Candidatus Absconditabacterales bacterium]
MILPWTTDNITQLQVNATYTNDTPTNKLLRHANCSTPYCLKQKTWIV